MMGREGVRSNKEASRFLRRTEASAGEWIDRLDECIIEGSGDFRPRIGPVKPIVESTVKEVWEQWRERGCNIKVVDELGEANVRLRERALAEVLTSLIVNSIQARARNISVVIRKTESSMEKSTESPAKELIELVVRDDGQGVPEAFRAQIGKFGWTSKPKDGTGIGLTVSHLLVKEMGGLIILLSGGQSAGRPFTEFAVRIPIAAP